MPSVFDDVFTEDAAAGGSVFDDVFQTPDIKPTPYEQRALIAPEIRPPTGMEAGTEFLTAVAPPIVEAERAAADLAGRGIEWAGNRVLDVANLPTTIANVAQARRQGIAGFTPDELSQANIPGQALRIEELPRPQFPRTSEEELAQINAGAALRTAAGIGNLVSGTVQGIAPPYASPEVGLTLPLLGGEGLINRIAMAAFAEETIRALPEEIQTAIETVKDPKATLEKKIEAVGKPAVTAYFARAMAKHAVGKPMVKAPFESVAEREGQLAPDIIRLRPGEEPIWQLEPKPLPTPSLIGPAGAMALQAQPQIQRPSEETPERISPAGEVPRVAPAGAAPMVLPPGADRTFFNPLGRRITGEELVRPPGAAPGEGATPLPEAQDLVRMTPNDMAEWRKGIRYGWMTSENIARNMSREDYTLLKNELPEMHRAMKDLLTQYGKERDANGGKETRESERIMGVYNKIQFKSQTFKEIIQDWDKLEAENRAAQPAVEPPTPIVESPVGALQTGAKAPTVSPVSATVTPKKPVDKPKLYRGTTLQQWEAIKRGEQPQSEYTSHGNTWVTTNLEAAMGYTRETGKNAVIIEYKDSAHDKVSRLTDDPGDHRRQGPLTLEDVQRVTDGEGNVIYEASEKPPVKPKTKKAAAAEFKKSVIENARLFVTSRAADIIEAGEAEGGDSASHAARSRYSEALRNLFQAVANKIGFTEGELGGRNATGARAAALPKLQEWLEKQKKPEAPVEERFIISKNPKTGEWDILDSKTKRIIPAGPSEETAREMARIWNEQPQEKTEAPVEEAPTEFPKQPIYPSGEKYGNEKFQAYWKELDQWRKDVESWVNAQPEDARIIWEEENGSVNALTPNIGDPANPWRVTHFSLNREGDQLMPWGHRVYPTRLKAILEEVNRPKQFHKTMPKPVMSEQEIRGYTTMAESEGKRRYWYQAENPEQIQRMKSWPGFQNELVIDSIKPNGEVAWTRKLDPKEMESFGVREINAPLVFNADYKGPRWRYGMRNRPLQIGAQPKGYIIDSNFPSEQFKNFGTIDYPFELTPEEVKSYELEPLGKVGEAKPKLLPGEKQGDLISSTQPEDITLVGEKGVDAERAAAEKAKAEADKKAAAEAAARQQQTLPGTQPKRLITDDQAKTLRDRIKARLQKPEPEEPPEGKVEAMAEPGKAKKPKLDARTFNDAVQLGIDYIQTGYHKPADFAAKLREDFGDEINDYIDSIYATAKVTIESPVSTSGASLSPGLQPGLRPPAERIVNPRKQYTPRANESVIPAELVQHLDEHQRQGAAAAINSLDRFEGFINADGTGAGKTRQALAVAKYYANKGLSVLIITKAETIGKPGESNWKKFGGSYYNDAKAMGVPVALARYGDVKPGQIGISTYENLVKIKDKVNNGYVLIFDESHALKNDSQRAKHAAQMMPKAKAVMFMSATPADKPQHIYYLARAGIMEGKGLQQQMRDLGMVLVTHKVFVKRGNRYVKEERTFYGPDPNVTKTERDARLNQLFDRMTQRGQFIKREISMDGVHVQVLELGLPPEAHDMQAHIIGTFLRAWHLNDPSEVGGNRKAVMLQALRRSQEPYKVGSAVTVAKRELDAGRTVVFFLSRINDAEIGANERIRGAGGDVQVIRHVAEVSEGTAKQLRNALHEAGIHDIAEIHGNSDQSSIEAMHDVQSGKKRVVIATVESGGTGINLDDVVGNRPRTMIMITPPFDAVGNIQAAGRIWRLKTMSGANMFYLLGDTQTDRWNFGIVGDKMSTLGAIVEGNVHKLNIADRELVDYEDFEISWPEKARNLSEEKDKVSKQKRPEIPLPPLEWKEFKTKTGAIRYTAPATKEFWDWWQASGKSDNPLKLRVSKYMGDWNVWADTLPAQGGKSKASSLLEELKADQSGNYSPKRTRLYQQLGNEVVPGIRLQDAEEAGRLYEIVSKGEATKEEWDKWVEDARRSGRISSPEGERKEEAIAEGGEEGLIFGGKFGMPLETEERGPMVRASDIIDKLANLMNRPIRIGGISLRKAAGVFKPDEQIARLRVANDLEAAAHETAHMLERAHRYALGKGIKEVDRKAWYKTMSPEAQKEFKDLDYDPSKRRIYEGWAEFMRHYLSIPNTETSYPNAYKWFRDVFLKDNPHLEQGIKEIRKDFTGYGQQGSVLRVKSMLRLSGQEKNLPMAQRAKRVYHTFRRLFEDDVYDIERVEREILGEGKTALGAVSPSKLARTVTQKSAAIAREWGLHGITDIAGNKVGHSLNEIFKKPGIRGQEEDALTFAVALRALYLHERGINPGIMLQDARSTVAKLDTPERRQFAKDITEFNEHALQYLVDAGVIGPETKAAVRKLNPVYLPFFRVFDKEGGGAGLGGRRIGDQPKGFKAIRGSGREIRDPIEAMTAQMERFISIANKTRVARSLVSLVKNAPGFEKFGRFVGEVPPEKFPFEFDLNSIKKQLQAAGIDLTGADLDQTITLFMNSPRTPKGGNIVGFWLNGKKRFFELDPELYRSIMALDFHRVHPLLDFLLGKLARTTRLGATGINPGFTLFTNLVRDYWTMMNQGRFNPLATTKLWLEHLGRQVGMRESEVLNLWKATGGEVAQPLGLDRKSIQQFRESILANTPKRLAYNIVRHPWEFLREAFSITEAAPRLAEFESTLREMGWKPGTPLTENMAIEAANNAAEVTVNFSRAGTWGRTINQMVAFHNPNIQGLAKFARSHRRSPVASGVRGLGTITSLAILNWYMNHKDEDWKNKPAWIKYGFLNWKIGDNWIRIPMPFEWWFAYGALPVAALEAIDKRKPGELEKMAGQAFQQLTPPLSPSAATPIFEVWRNKSFYSGKPIDPKSMQRLPVQERAMPYTAQTSKKVAQILSAGGVSVSPVQVEHVLRAETGGLYTDLIRASERLVGLSAEAPVREPADLPVVGRIFARDGESAVIDEMYDQMEHLMQKQATAKLYRQQGTPNWEKYELNGEEAAQLRDMQRASQRLTKLRKEYNASTDRQDRRRIFSEMTDLAKQALD